MFTDQELKALKMVQEFSNNQKMIGGSETPEEFISFFNLTSIEYKEHQKYYHSLMTKWFEEKLELQLVELL